MTPEYTAYQASAHSHVACVACHVGEGAKSYVKAKVNGTKQLIEVTFDSYPRPIPSPVTTGAHELAPCIECFAMYGPRTKNGA